MDLQVEEFRIRCIALLLLRRRKKELYSTKRFWVRPIYRMRQQQGDFNNLIHEMRLTDTESYFNYFRMTANMFDDLLALVGPSLEKVSLTRDAISPSQRLCVTLRYLAAGDSMRTLSFAYRLGTTTVSNIIKETTSSLWNILKDKVFPTPNKAYWKATANEFEKYWNFPNCVGAVDGKHVKIQAPLNSGSEFHNYKSYFSIVLIGVGDAKYCFSIVDIGASGRQSDGGIFNQSSFGKALQQNKLKLPPPSKLPKVNFQSPYVFVADEAFLLKPYMMRPYPGRNVGLEEYFKITYNYRMSRARRVIENIFGIMGARFRILHKTIIGTVENIENVIRAVVCLHNFIQKSEISTKPSLRKYCPPQYVDREDADGNVQPGAWRTNIPSLTSLRKLDRIGTNDYSNKSEDIRDNLAKYFMGAGRVSWQWEKLPKVRR